MTKVLQKCFIFLIVCCLSSITFAQDNGLSTWFTMRVTRRFNSKLSLSTVAEYRSDDYFKDPDRWGIALNADYRFLPFLRAEGGYEVHHRNRGDDGWNFRQRYGIGLIASVRWGQFNLALRERFQQTFDHGDIQSNFRSRAEIVFVPRNSILSPFFSIELYQQIGHQSFWEIDRLRYRPGIDLKLPNGWNLDFFYCFQYSPNGNRNITGIDCS